MKILRPVKVSLYEQVYKSVLLYVVPGDDRSEEDPGNQEIIRREEKEETMFAVYTAVPRYLQGMNSYHLPSPIL